MCLSIFLTMHIFFFSMRLFKRRCSDPSPQLVSLSPIEQDQRDVSPGYATPKGCTTPDNGSPKPHKKSKC